jgi:hypothetical protein
MHPKQTPIISAHRLARLIIWFAGVLAWFAYGCAVHTAAERRRHARYGAWSQTRLIRTVRNIIIIRAAQLLAFPRRSKLRTHPLNAPQGCRRAMRGNLLRAVGGAWLRRKLKVRGGLIAQALHLLAVLRQLNTFVVRFARLRRNGLTRPAAIICVAPRADLMRDYFAPAPSAADSS